MDHGAPVWDDGDWSKLYMSIACHVMLRHGLAAFDHNQVATYFPSQPVLEAAIRRRAEAIDNVDIRDGTDVAELTVTADRRRVTGVTVTNGDGTASQDLGADLVVDAMGRSAHTPAFLDSLGYGRPHELHVKALTCYVRQPIGNPHRYRIPSSQWRRYDKMRRFPDGLLVSGDAICSFNPI